MEMTQSDSPAYSAAGRTKTGAWMRVLIVEDEYYLADDLARALEAGGHEVLGPVGTVEEAEQAVAEDGFDVAIIDMNLHGDNAFPVADRLKERGIPFVIATGYSSASLPERFADAPRIEKPFGAEAVIAALPDIAS